MILLGSALVALGLILFITSLFDLLRQLKDLQKKVELFGKIEHTIWTHLGERIIRAFTTELGSQRTQALDLARQSADLLALSSVQEPQDALYRADGQSCDADVALNAA